MYTIIAIVFVILTAVLLYFGRGQGGSLINGVWMRKLARIPSYVWSSRYRWWWIGLAVFLLFAYGMEGYKVFYTDEGKGIKKAKVDIVSNEFHISFEIPEDVKYKRIELLEHLAVKSKPGNLVGFKFPNAKMREYTLPGQKTTDRFLNKIFKPLFGMVFQKEEHYEGKEYEWKTTRKGEVILFKGSEVEWNKPPYIIIAKTDEGEVPNLSAYNRPLKYRIVDQESLGRIEKTESKKK